MIEELKKIKYEIYECSSIIRIQSEKLEELKTKNTIAIDKLSKLINDYENQLIASKIEEALITKNLKIIEEEKGYHDEFINYIASKEELKK